MPWSATAATTTGAPNGLSAAAASTPPHKPLWENAAKGVGYAAVAAGLCGVVAGVCEGVRPGGSTPRGYAIGAVAAAVGLLGDGVVNVTNGAGFFSELTQ
jgi:hypothetical protein